MCLVMCTVWLSQEAEQSVHAVFLFVYETTEAVEAVMAEIHSWEQSALLSVEILK